METVGDRVTLRELVPPVVGLLLFGILISDACVGIGYDLPRQIYFESSFYLALLNQSPVAVFFAVANLALVAWLFVPARGGRLSWDLIDRVGSLRWPIFIVAGTFAWAYAGYQYNYYFDQSHVWDRWILILLWLGILRSPLLIPIFLLAMIVSRGQFLHPISDLIPIGDELPIRVLGIVAVCAVWNACVKGLATRDRRRRLASIQTTTLVYSILCLVGFYYSFAGSSKLRLGASLIDWIRFNHLENLFVATYLNGWLNFLSPSRVLELADLLRSLSIPISIGTLVIEIGMAFLLLRQRGTLWLLATVASMHLGILVTSGIIFWKWMVLDLCLFGWLWGRRNDLQIARMYSRSGFIVSLVMIGLLSIGIGKHPFSWWNTKLVRLYEVEVLDASGNVYLVDYSDFSPYTLSDSYDTRVRRAPTFVFGFSVSQALMELLEETNPESLRQILAKPKAGNARSDNDLKRRSFTNFMRRYFKSRNALPRRNVVPFLIPAPSVHNRYLSGPNLYRDQAPIVEAHLRFREIYYSGSELYTMHDEVVFSVPIPPPDD